MGAERRGLAPRPARRSPRPAVAALAGAWRITGRISDLINAYKCISGAADGASATGPVGAASPYAALALAASSVCERAYPAPLALAPGATRTRAPEPRPHRGSKKLIWAYAPSLHGRRAPHKGPRAGVAPAPPPIAIVLGALRPARIEPMGPRGPAPTKTTPASGTGPAGPVVS